MKLLRIALFVCVFMLVASSRLGQHGHRDATMLFLAYRHGLRVSELVALTGSRRTSRAVCSVSVEGGAWKTTVAIHSAVAAEKRGFRTAVFDLDPQASATSWADRRQSPPPTVVSAPASRLPNLLQQAARQSADLVLIDSAPNADSAS